MKRLFVFLLMIVYPGILGAQISDKILRIEAKPSNEKEPVTITAELMPGANIDKIEIAYRSFGQSEYKRLDMSITGNNVSVTIPTGQTSPPFVEYYLIIYESNVETFTTFPIENPAEHPLKLEIIPSESQSYEVIWISPESSENVSKEDLLVAFYLYDGGIKLNLSKTKIFIDEEDVTSYAIQSEDMLVVRPDNFGTSLNVGKHWIRLEIFDITGKSVGTETREFTLIPDFIVGSVTDNINYRASIQMETRNENIAGLTNSYNRGSVNASGEYRMLKINGRVYATNEEKSDRQPQNRYFIGAELPWLKVGFGDSYPALPNLILNGKRVRGLTTNLKIGFFNIDLVYGETDRKIESKITRDIPDSLVGRDRTKTYFKPDTLTWARMDHRGSFTRNLLAVRPSFGKGENFLLGFSFLKSKDDKNSIRYGLMPQENLVLGSDFLFVLDKRRIELTAQVAFSATNNDIAGGDITDEEIDSVFKSMSKEDRDMLRTVRDVFSNLITVNRYIVPLSFKNLTTLAYEGALNLNYFNNKLRLTYIRRGESFESFGQPYIRTDVSGFNINDRLRLFNNRFLLSVGYEKLEDNTAKTKLAQTKYSTLNTMVSYYPSVILPNISLGYTYVTTLNSLPHDSTAAMDDNMNRIFFQLGYNFTLLGKQNIIFYFGTSKRDDFTKRNLDTKNNSVSLGINTIYSIPLQTMLNVSVNNSSYLSSFGKPDSIKTNKINYTSASISANYRLLENRLRIDAGIRSTFGDIQRGVFDLGAQYSIISNLDLIGRFNIYTHKQIQNDLVWNLTIVYNLY
ncbi:MAG: hypothetical protein KJ963_09055 [Bacteroidetes bacterium]|nr:hypothetical protein [Bacteroidota bacterium]